MGQQMKTPGAAGTATEGLELASVGNSTLSSDPLQEPLDAVTHAERDVAAWRVDVAEFHKRNGDTPLPPDAFYDHPANALVARWIDVRMADRDLPPRGVNGWRHIAAEILSLPLDGLFRRALHLEGISRIAENKVMRALTLAERVEALEISLEHAALAAVAWELLEVHTGMTQDDDDPQPVDFPPFVTLRVTA